MTDLDPEFEKKLQAQVDAINMLTDRHAEGKEIGPLIDEIDEKRVRGLVAALIMVRVGDREKLRQVLDRYDERERARQAKVDAFESQVRDQTYRETKRALDAPDLSAAHLRIEELERIVEDQQQLIDALRRIGEN